MELKLSAPRLRVLWLVLLLLVPVSASVGPVAQGQEAGSEKREGKQPSVVNSTEIAPVPGLQPPDALPPPGLEGVAGSPLAQAGEHLLRAEVLDALGVRIARRVLVLQWQQAMRAPKGPSQFLMMMWLGKMVCLRRIIFQKLGRRCSVIRWSSWIVTIVGVQQGPLRISSSARWRTS